MAKPNRISVTLDEESAAWLREKAAANNSTIAAELREAVRQQKLHDARIELLKWMGTDDLAAADLAAIRREIDG